MIDSVKVGALRYAVRLVEDLRDGDQKLNGWVLHDQCEIRVETTLHEQVRRVCVIHEAFHAVALQASQEIDEAHIDVLAHGLYGLLRDNPALVAWLCEDDHADRAFTEALERSLRDNAAVWSALATAEKGDGDAD
jgi:hypothetical protein